VNYISKHLLYLSASVIRVCMVTRQTWSTKGHQFKVGLHGLHELPGSLFHKSGSTVYHAVWVPTCCLFPGNPHFSRHEIASVRFIGLSCHTHWVPIRFGISFPWGSKVWKGPSRMADRLDVRTNRFTDGALRCTRLRTSCMRPTCSSTTLSGVGY